MKGSSLLFERKKLVSISCPACRLLLGILTFTYYRENAQPPSTQYPPSKVQQLHAKFCHIDLRTLIKFKRNNKIKSLGLPPRILREYIDHQCPICHTMKRRHPKRSSSLSNAEKCNFEPCQTVYVDTSGKWRSKSSHSNHYHTVLICVRSVLSLCFPTKSDLTFR